MQKVYAAIESYKKEHKDTSPKELSDLKPYLFNYNEVYCPMMLKKGEEVMYLYTPEDKIILTCLSHKRGKIEIKRNGKIVIENLTIGNLRKWIK